MKLRENVSLKHYSTMRLGGETRYFSEINSLEDLQEAARWTKQHHLELRVIGGGSNIVFSDRGFGGLIAVNKLKGINVVSEDTRAAIINCAAGEEWDEFVEYTVKRGLSGIETLSLIPGSVGAAPVQNIGAYGQQLADTFIELQAYDIENDGLVTIPKSGCEFAYRTSRFKGVRPQRFIIVSITLKLFKSPAVKPPVYADIERYFAEIGQQIDFSPAAIREAVVTIRTRKLPDPSKIANNGSFFKHPVVTEAQLEKIRQKYPELPADRVDDGKLKIRTGWLLEKLGYKGYRHPNGMGTYDNQALVIVNYGAKSSKDLEDFVAQIKKDVREVIGLELEQEPELIT